jgi:outer membrane protein assembly factor BamA
MRLTEYPCAWCCRTLSVFLAWCLIVLSVHEGSIATAADGLADAGTVFVETVDTSGLIHTKPETLVRLLPRSLPASFTKAEIEEFERRIRNLSLFDLVRVGREGDRLTLAVQEKITLAPIMGFTSGSSLQDMNATIGLVEYNIGGTGTQLGGQFSYSQRGPNAELWLAQHALEPGRWAKELKGAYASNGIRFSDSSTSWTRNRLGGEFEIKGPYGYGSPLRYEVVFRAYHESVHDETGASKPSGGYYVGLIPEITWDQYHWHDLVPKGYRITLEVKPGFFFGANQQRHEIELQYLHALPLGATTVLMVNQVFEAVNNSGNPNHSLLIGSIRGVRGLSDNLYRTRAQGYANVELRHAIPIAARWALQGVLFTDVGGFQSFSPDGTVRDWETAVSAGTGIRVVPTFLSNTLLRVDAARLFSPVQNWLVQVGITQYF